jgi:hypothetical protein
MPFGDRARLCGGVSLIVLLVTGCMSTGKAPPAPTPDLQLLSAATLDLPQGCEAGQGAIYRTSFTVQPDGHVTHVASASGDGCVQDALRRWVSTFRYQPVGKEVPAVIDWMNVTASRGG